MDLELGQLVAVNVHLLRREQLVGLGRVAQLCLIKVEAPLDVVDGVNPTLLAEQGQLVKRRLPLLLLPSQKPAPGNTVLVRVRQLSSSLVALELVALAQLVGEAVE